MNSLKVLQFQIIGEDLGDPLGLWTPVDTQSESAVSFDLPSGAPSPQPEQPVYRVSIAAESDLVAAEREFAFQEARMSALGRALGLVPGKLSSIVGSARSDQQISSTEAVAFEIGDVSARDAVEAELLSLITEADQVGTTSESTTGMVDFGMGEMLSPALESAKVQFNQLMDQVNREVFHFAWVETVVLGRLLARTTVDWSGDADTIWAADIMPEHVSLHHRALKFAVKSRALKMQMVLTITGGATTISAMMTNPSAALLALPGVCQYVTRVLAQVREYRELATI